MSRQPVTQSLRKSTLTGLRCRGSFRVRYFLHTLFTNNDLTGKFNITKNISSCVHWPECLCGQSLARVFMSDQVHSEVNLFLAASINWFLVESRSLAILPYPALSAAVTWVSDFLHLHLQICIFGELQACKATDSTIWVGLGWGRGGL